MEKFEIEGELSNMGGREDITIILRYNASNMSVAAHIADKMAERFSIKKYKLSRIDT